MKKVFQATLSLVLVAIMMFSIVSTSGIVKAAELGTMPSNPINLSDGVYYTKYWTSGNYDLNCYNKIVVPSRGYITFTAEKPFDDEGEMGTYVLTLYNGDGTVVWEADTDPQQNTFSSNYVYKIGLAAGTYFMNVDPSFYVYSDSAPIGTKYKYDFTKSSSWEIESNDTQSTATKLDLGKMYKGVFSEQSYDTPYTDYFAVRLEKGVKYRLKFGNYNALEASTSMIFDFIDPTGEDLYLGYEKESNDITYWDVTAARTGTYYLKLHNSGWEPGIEYSIGVYYVPVKCSKPTLKSVENSEYGVLTKWGTVKGADRYKVYRKTSGGSWKYLGYTTKNYYTDKTAKSGTKYYYGIKAVNDAGSSSLSNSLSKYYLACPTLYTPKSTTTGVTLKWSKVVGAQGYYIYRKTGSGSYKKIKTEKGVSNLAYKDAGAKKGKKCTYKVKAYYGKTYSAISSGKSVTVKY